MTAVIVDLTKTGDQVPNDLSAEFIRFERASSTLPISLMYERAVDICRRINEKTKDNPLRSLVIYIDNDTRALLIAVRVMTMYPRPLSRILIVEGAGLTDISDFTHDGVTFYKAVQQEGGGFTHIYPTETTQGSL